MPPPLFAFLSFPFTQLAHVLFPGAPANGIIAGAFVFCELYSVLVLLHGGDRLSTDVIYDCMHYALHHTKLPEYMREMKKYHLAHHYKNFELGFISNGSLASESSVATRCVGPFLQIPCLNGLLVRN